MNSEDFESYLTRLNFLPPKRIMGTPSHASDIFIIAREATLPPYD